MPLTGGQDWALNVSVSLTPDGANAVRFTGSNEVRHTFLLTELLTVYTYVYLTRVGNHLKFQVKLAIWAEPKAHPKGKRCVLSDSLTKSTQVWLLLIFSSILLFFSSLLCQTQYRTPRLIRAP